jgi:hypothetical protein
MGRKQRKNLFKCQTLSKHGRQVICKQNNAAPRSRFGKDLRKINVIAQRNDLDLRTD